MNIRLENLSIVYSDILAQKKPGEICYSDAPLHFPLDHAYAKVGKKGHLYYFEVYICPERPEVFREISRVLQTSGLREDFRWHLTSDHGLGYILDAQGERIITISREECQEHDRMCRKISIGTSGATQRPLMIQDPNAKKPSVIPCGLEKFKTSVDELAHVTSLLIRSCYEGKFSEQGKKLRATRAGPIHMSL